jgi:hypothetical protein
MSVTYFDKLEQAARDAMSGTKDQGKLERLAEACGAIYATRSAYKKAREMIDWLGQRLADADRALAEGRPGNLCGIVQGTGSELDMANQAFAFALRNLENAWGRAGLGDLPKD